MQSNMNLDRFRIQFPCQRRWARRPVNLRIRRASTMSRPLKEWETRCVPPISQELLRPRRRRDAGCSAKVNYFVGA